MQRQIAELDELERIVDAARGRLEASVVAQVADGERRFPLYALRLGTSSTQAPAVGFFAGVHGLERVGTHVVLAFLASLVARLERDESFERLLGLQLYAGTSTFSKSVVRSRSLSPTVRAPVLPSMRITP